MSAPLPIAVVIPAVAVVVGSVMPGTAVVTLVLHVVTPAAGSPMVLPEPVAMMAVITVAHEIVTGVIAVMVATTQAAGGRTTRLGACSGAARVAMAAATTSASVRTARPTSATAAGRGAAISSPSAAAASPCATRAAASAEGRTT